MEAPLLNFGKYRGYKIDRILKQDKSYCEWLVWSSLSNTAHVGDRRNYERVISWLKHNKVDKGNQEVFAVMRYFREKE